MFDTDWEYKTFLGLVKKYILPVTEIYAYCLLPNHFHFLVRNKEVDIPENFARKGEHHYFSHQWGNVQNTYTKKKYFRNGKRGGLFCQSINRNLIDSEEYLQMCLVYIHNNPVKHGYTSSPESWDYSSYKAIISKQKTDVEREKVLKWFDSAENFMDYHRLNVDEIFAEK